MTIETVGMYIAWVIGSAAMWAILTVAIALAWGALTDKK